MVAKNWLLKHVGKKSTESFWNHCMIDMYGRFVEKAASALKNLLHA